MFDVICLMLLRMFDVNIFICFGLVRRRLLSLLVVAPDRCGALQRIALVHLALHESVSFAVTQESQ